MNDVYKFACSIINNDKKNHFLQLKENDRNIKEAYKDGSKSIGKKVGFATVFTDITKIGTLPEKTSIPQPN